MEIKFYVEMPSCYDTDLVEEYLKVLEKDIQYDAWTISDELRLIQCKGSIESDGSWNYHNNYDDSEDRLYIRLSKSNIRTLQWFTLNKSEAEKIQKENIKRYLEVLEQEIKKVNEL